MSQESTNPNTFNTADGNLRVRQADGAVYVEGLGYVSELPALGGRESALEAARKAIVDGKSKQVSGANKSTKATATDREKLGFG